MQRNPNGATPRTMRDCTFCEWADPIETPRDRWAPVAWTCVLVAAALGVVVWWKVVAP